MNPIRPSMTVINNQYEVNAPFLSELCQRYPKEILVSDGQTTFRVGYGTELYTETDRSDLYFTAVPNDSTFKVTFRDPMDSIILKAMAQGLHAAVNSNGIQIQF